MSLDQHVPRSHRSLALEQWPDADRGVWAAANWSGELFDNLNRAAAWRPASRRAAAGSYGRWLGWLAGQGIALKQEEPASRITTEKVQAYVAFLREGQASVTIASYLGTFCMALRALFPEENWGWLQAMQRNARRQASPSRNKAARLVPSYELLQLALDLMASAAVTLDSHKDRETGDGTVVAAARDFRDGLLIGLLSLRPLRVKNLLGIESGKQLHPMAGRMFLTFTASETKNHRKFEMPWPEELAQSLGRYLDKVRPILIAAKASTDPSRPKRLPGSFLWISQGGAPLTPGGLQKLLERHTIPHFGHLVNAHVFRDAVASTMANECLYNTRYGARMLGHTGSLTAERSYIIPDSNPALESHHDLISSMRKRARQQARNRAEDMP